MNLTNERVGEITIFFEALLWSFFPIITILSLNILSPILSLAWSTFFAAVFFGIILFYKKSWKNLNIKSAWKDVILTSVILGVIYYALFFIGLKNTSAGNAGLLATSEIFFTFLFFNIWHKEYISFFHILGAFLMLIGTIVILFPNSLEFKFGDILIISAAFVAPLGNYFQRRARKTVKSEIILFVRSIIGSFFLFICLFFSGIEIFPTMNTSFLYLIINGFFLLGLSKILWIEGIHRIGVTKAISLSSLSPLLTLIFSWIILNESPSQFQMLSFVPIFFGIIFLSKQ